MCLPWRDTTSKNSISTWRTYLPEICMTARNALFCNKLRDGACWMAKHILEAPDYDNYYETKTLAGIQMEKKTHVAKNLIAHEVHKCNESEWTRRRHGFTNWSFVVAFSLVLSGPTVTFHPIVNTWFRRYINFCYIYEQREVSGKSLRILSLFTFAMKPSTMLPFWLSRSCLSPATSSSPLKLNGRQCWELNPPQRFGDAYVIATRKGSSESNGYVREGTDSNDEGSGKEEAAAMSGRESGNCGKENL